MSAFAPALMSDVNDLTAENFFEFSFKGDKNDKRGKKYSRIEKFDDFQEWVDGDVLCRYTPKDTDAKKHLSGWAMRNTNNHNKKVLKKSCLGVFLCSKNCRTAEGDQCAVRPATSDRARKKQAEKKCSNPQCDGKLVHRQCFGKGGYPVTHFWRPTEQVILFQSKGFHDHPRPDVVKTTSSAKIALLEYHRMHRHERPKEICRKVGTIIHKSFNRVDRVARQLREAQNTLTQLSGEERLNFAAKTENLKFDSLRKQLRMKPEDDPGSGVRPGHPGFHNQHHHIDQWGYQPAPQPGPAGDLYGAYSGMPPHVYGGLQPGMTAYGNSYYETPASEWFATPAERQTMNPVGSGSGGEAVFGGYDRNTIGGTDDLSGGKRPTNVILQNMLKRRQMIKDKSKQQLYAGGPEMEEHRHHQHSTSAAAPSELLDQSTSGALLTSPGGTKRPGPPLLYTDEKRSTHASTHADFLSSLAAKEGSGVAAASSATADRHLPSVFDIFDMSSTAVTVPSAVVSTFSPLTSPATATSVHSEAVGGEEKSSIETSSSEKLKTSAAATATTDSASSSSSSSVARDEDPVTLSELTNVTESCSRTSATSAGGSTATLASLTTASANAASQEPAAAESDNINYLVDVYLNEKDTEKPLNKSEFSVYTDTFNKSRAQILQQQPGGEPGAATTSSSASAAAAYNPYEHYKAGAASAVSSEYSWPSYDTDWAVSGHRRPSFEHSLLSPIGGGFTSPHYGADYSSISYSDWYGGGAVGGSAAAIGESGTSAHAAPGYGHIYSRGAFNFLDR